MNKKVLFIAAGCFAFIGLLSFALNNNAVKSPAPQEVTTVEEVRAEADETVNWMSLEQAIEAQKKSPKPIMMDVYTNWCGPCRMLDKNTFQDARVAKYLNQNFYSVKFNAEGPDALIYQGVTYNNPDYDESKKAGRNGVHEFTIALGVNSYPTVYFMDDGGQPLMPLIGYRTPAQIELYLHLFGEGKYREIETQQQFEEWEKSFVVTWN